jgi:hypothetical protein
MQTATATEPTSIPAFLPASAPILAAPSTALTPGNIRNLIAVANRVKKMPPDRLGRPQWTCACPYHKDGNERHPSYRITLSDEKILICCDPCQALGQQQEVISAFKNLLRGNPNPFPLRGGQRHRRLHPSFQAGEAESLLRAVWCSGIDAGSF